MGICGGSKKDQPITPKQFSSDANENTMIQNNDNKHIFQVRNSESIKEPEAIKSPESPNRELPTVKSNMISQREAFRRRAKGHHTVILNKMSERKLKMMMHHLPSPLDTKENISTPKKEFKVERRNKKSITVIEKNKITEKLFK